MLLAANFLDRLGGQSPDWVSHWLTPMWILGLGALLGLVACAVAWAIASALSRIPFLGNLQNKPQERRWAIGILSVVFFLLFFSAAQRVSRGPEDGENKATIAAPALVALPVAVCALIAATAAVALVSRANISLTWDTVREGALWPAFLILSAWAVFGVLGIVVVREPSKLLETLVRFPSLISENIIAEKFTLKATPTDVEDVETSTITLKRPVLRNEIQALQFKATERVKLAPDHFEHLNASSVTFDIPAEETIRWERPKDGSTPFPNEIVTELFARNYGERPVELEIWITRRPAYPEMLAVPIFAFSILLVFLLAIGYQGAFPKMAAISLATVKSELAQPMFPLLVGTGIVLILAFVWVPYNTFGEDIKMLKDTGLGLILVMCIVQAVWAASSSVADEIEGRTALTLLSKPVGRRDFILGKFIGIGWTTALLCFVLGLTLLIGVAYKPIYDAREGANYEATWQFCFAEMVRVVPGLLLALMEALVMTALSVAISTRLPTLPNFIICFSIYALGHLTPLIVQSQVVAQQFEPVIFIGRFIATILPVLEYFNIQASISAGADVPLAYLGWAFVYCVLYSSVALLVALFLFEDRDLA